MTARRIAHVLLVAAALAGMAAFEYAFLVWLSGPYECINCDPE